MLLYCSLYELLVGNVVYMKDGRKATLQMQNIENNDEEVQNVGIGVLFEHSG